MNYCRAFLQSTVVFAMAFQVYEVGSNFFFFSLFYFRCYCSLFHRQGSLSQKKKKKESSSYLPAVGKELCSLFAAEIMIREAKKKGSFCEAHWKRAHFSTLAHAHTHPHRRSVAHSPSVDAVVFLEGEKREAQKKKKGEIWNKPID